MIIGHRHQTENGKDREEHWIHMVIGMIKSEFPIFFKGVKPTITKTGDLLELKGLKINEEIFTERELKIDGKVLKYRIKLSS